MKRRCLLICMGLLLVSIYSFGQTGLVGCQLDEPPPNNGDGSGQEFYPYKSRTITVFGYPASETQKQAVFTLNLPAERKWKDNFRYRQDYYIYYNGSNFGNTITLTINDQIVNDDSKIDIDLWSGVCQKKFAGTPWLCDHYKPASKYGTVELDVEIPIWDTENQISSLCVSDASIDLSSFLINKINSKNIDNASYYINGVPDVDGSIFDPSKFQPGQYVITAKKTYCNSQVFGNSGDFISDNYVITVKGTDIEFPQNALIVCNNASQITLLATPTGGTWANSDNATDSAVNGNNFIPLNSKPGNYSLEYSYTDPSTNCTAKKILPVSVVATPLVTAGGDQKVLINAGVQLLPKASPSGGIWSGDGVSGNNFDPQKAGICNHLLTYTYTDPTTNCSVSSSINYLVMPFVGNDQSVCQNGGTVSLSNREYPQGGIFAGEGISNNVFDPSSLAAGDYVLTYTVTNSVGCSVSNSFTMTVLPVPDIPTVTGLSQGCDGTEIQLAASTPTGKDLIYHWFKENDTIPFYTGSLLTYSINGNETLYCQSENSVGCFSTAKESISIESFNPKSDFQADKTVVPFGGLVKFNSTLSGVIYNWDFGDGGVANVQNPAHYYNNSGLFTVKLVLLSSQGCSSQILKTAYISVADQQAVIQPIQQSPGDGFDTYKSTFDVYPSPFSNYIEVAFQLNDPQVVNLDLFDEKGQWMIHKVYNGSQGANDYKILEVQSLSRSGFYFLKITSRDINRVEKLLKM